MLKELKNKIKLFLYGELVTDTYYMYAYKIITINGEEFKCNMEYYTLFDFKDWVDLCLLKNKSITVSNNTLLNRSVVKDIVLVRVMDTFNYTRRDRLSDFKGCSLGVCEVEELIKNNSH